VFDTVLVADRGLVACRVVRTCQRLGARTVTVHAAADAARRHSRRADESLLLDLDPGSSDPGSTYLDGLKVIEAAGQAGAQAVHPGASPLAASAAFATAVQEAGLTWVGPPPEALAALEPVPAPQAGDLLLTLLASAAGQVTVVGDSSRDAAGWSSPAHVADDVRARAVGLAEEAVGRAGLVGLVQAVVDHARDAVTGLRPWLSADQAVVELVSGVDLVEQSLLLAAGKPALEDTPRSEGAAVLVVLRAVGAGRLGRLELPAGVDLRVDLGADAGEDVDAREAVLTLAARADTDGEARERLAAARGQLAVEGIELEETS